MRARIRTFGAPIALAGSALLLLLLAARGMPPGAAPGPGATAERPASAARAGPTAAPTPGPGMYANPVIDGDFPDPDTLLVGDTYYAYATNSGSTNVLTARSRDLVRWELLKDALPVLPPWSQPGHTWAPEVTTAADGAGYVMYFTARHAGSQRQCIGAATSAVPEGPFRSPSDRPFVCQLDEGGSIDASSFVDDDGSRYVLWKSDGNCCGKDTWIYLQAVSRDGLSLEGTPRRLIRADQAWEGSVVEAPTLWKRAGTYYLFYSANRYAGADYAVGYAVADAPAGPYRKPGRPLLSTSTENGPVIGPGGQDVVTKEGRTWLLYHTWDQTVTYRGVSVDELVWNGHTPVVQSLGRMPRPVP